MKKTKCLSIILTGCMVFSLTACGGKSSTTSDSISTSSSSSNGVKASSTSESGKKVSSLSGSNVGSETSVDIVGTVDENVDYKAGKKYHFVYICTEDQTLEQQMLEAYQSLQDKYNFEIEYVQCDGDSDTYVQNLQTLVDRGDVDGLIVEAQSYMSDALLPILQESGIPWINQFTEFYDSEGNLACPVVIVPQYETGYNSVQWLCDHYPEYWGEDINPEEVGLINFDFSTSQPLADRTKGSTDAFIDAGFPEDNVFVVDTYALGEQYWMTMDGGYQPTTTTVSSNPDIKYWMVAACVEYYSQGAARAAEDLNLNDSMLITDVGSPYFEEEVESGYEGAWVCCVCINNYAYATPIILGLRAICDGRATEESLWPNLHNYFTDNDKYGTWRADYKIVTANDYKEYEDSIEAIYGP